MKDYLLLGIDKGLISFNEDKSRIRYNRQKKERNYNNPEEKVQVLAFLQLILDYNYPESRIRQFEPVTMGSAQPPRSTFCMECRRNAIFPHRNSFLNSVQNRREKTKSNFKYRKENGNI